MRAGVLGIVRRIEEDDEGLAGVRHLARFASAAYQVAVRVLGTPQGAEDAVQQAYLNALTYLGSAASPLADERTWFLRVVANAAKEYGRKEMTLKRREARAMPSLSSAMQPRESEDEDTVTALRLALSSMEEKYRVPVCLCYEQDLTRSEAGAVLGMPESTVRKYVNVGLGKLRKTLESGGYPAAVGVVLGGLKQTAPAVPASLAGRVEALVMSGAKADPGNLASRAARKRSVAKGGYTMKILAGIIFAGALAAGVAVVSGRGVTPPLPSTPLGAGPAEATPAAERVYTCSRVLSGGRLRSYSEWVTCGPRKMARVYKLNGVAADNQGNVYGLVKAQVGRGGSEGQHAYECVIVKLDPKTDRVTRLAGGARGGALDGPGEIAQFQYQFYSSGGFKIDPERGYLYVTSNGQVRRIRTSDGYVTTIAPEIKGVSGAAVDQEGVVYAGVPHRDKKGIWRLTPQGPKGKETYKVERVSAKGWGGYLEADAKRGKVYGAGRGGNIGTVQVWDLSAGKFPVTPQAIAKPNGSKAKYYASDGPLEGATFWCPCGLSRSPDGRYLYFGGGDEYTYRRIDVDKRRISSLYQSNGYHRYKGRTDPAYRFTWKERKAEQHLFPWPLASFEAPDGKFYIGGSSHGLYVLTPVKK